MCSGGAEGEEMPPALRFSRLSGLAKARERLHFLLSARGMEHIPFYAARACARLPADGQHHVVRLQIAKSV